MLALRRRDHQAEPPFMRSIVVFVLVKTLLLFVNEVAAAAAAAVTTSTYNNTMGLAIFSRTAAPHLATSKFSHYLPPICPVSAPHLPRICPASAPHLPRICILVETGLVCLQLYSSSGA